MANVERRRFKRMGLDVKLYMTRVDEANAPGISVDVLDVSRAGIGFICSEEITNGAVYKADIRIWTGDTITAFINVVRVNHDERGTVYGGIFIGMPESDWVRICVYEEFQDHMEETGEK